jgi:NDP-sugar pyrophosphorylase family protein
MGIYVFNRDLLVKFLDNEFTDFGKHIIPDSIPKHRVYAHVFQGYWEDIGTIRAFFDANLELTAVLPRFNFFDMSAPIFTRPRFLPSSKINGGNIEQALISDGCIINHATYAIPSSGSAASSITAANSSHHPHGRRLLRVRRLHRPQPGRRSTPHRHRPPHPHRKRHHR